MALKLRPKDVVIGDSYAFMGSGWNNMESETIARNVVFIQQATNTDHWTPFSWDDYKRLCKHDVTESERGVLEAFVSGGKPIWKTTAVLPPGYLLKDESGLYSVTNKFIDAIPASQKTKG
jgi:hypothetical protein